MSEAEIPMLGHDWVKGATIAPTCTEYGYTNYTCRRCRETKEDDSVEPNGHNFVSGWQTVTEPTCTNRGSEKRTCLTCGHTETREVEALGHDWGAPDYDDSFSSGQSHTCERCGEVEEYS